MLVTVLIILAMVIIDEHIQKRLMQDKGVLESLWFEEERRQSPRLNINLDVVYKMPNKADNLNRSGNSSSKNISKSGVQLLLKEKFEKDTILLLEFELPGILKKKLLAEGQVVWTRENQLDKENGIRTFDTGIRFIQIDESAQKALSNYVNKHLSV
jgi:c-di-GMP-binding flagellar brake protein YcgR